MLGSSCANTTTSPLAGIGHGTLRSSAGVPPKDRGSSEGCSPRWISHGRVMCKLQPQADFPQLTLAGLEVSGGVGNGVPVLAGTSYLSAVPGGTAAAPLPRASGERCSRQHGQKFCTSGPGCRHPEPTRPVNGREELGGSFARCEVLFARDRKVYLLPGRVAPKRDRRDFSGMRYVNRLGSLPLRCKAGFLQPLLSESRSRGAGTVLRRHPTQCVRLGVFPLLSRSSC